MSDVRDFLLPDLGEGLESGEIVEWHVAVGDHVELNQEICDVEIAKAVVSIPCPFSGTVVERFGEVGEELEVGQPLIRIDVEEVAADAEMEEVAGPAAEAVAGGEAGPEAAPEDTAAESDAGSRHSVLVGYGAAEGGGRGRRRRRAGSATDRAPGDGHREGRKPKAKPPVRKLAKDLGVDLHRIAPGSGPQGIVTREDVRAAAQEPEPTAGAPPTGAASGTEVEPGVPGFRGRSPGDVIPVTGIRRRITEKMVTSRREIPEATTEVTVDCTATWELAARLSGADEAVDREVRITPFALAARAAVLALRRFPTLNATLDTEAGEIRLLEPVHLGIATDTDRGLLVPVVEDAHRRSTLDLAAEAGRVVRAARDGSIAPSDLTGGTFTVNNYGALGNDRGDPIINHPEAAILGVGAMNLRPWVVDGALSVRRTVTLTVAFDHRICDGGEAGRFVAYVGELIEDPARILLHA